MALTKQPIPINFRQGLDTKTDPYQVALGKFLSLKNSVFTTTGRLTKRNGFSNVTRLPDTEQTTLTTLNDNLIATGSNLYAFSKDTDEWLNQGIVQPVRLGVQSLVRVSTSQTAPDTALSSSGLVLLTYVDNGVAYYQVSDSTTGQQIVQRVTLESTATNPRVFVLGPWFIITYVANIAATPTLRYVSIPTVNPLSPNIPVTISSNVNSLQAGYDAYVVDVTMFIAWGQSAASIGIVSLSSALALSTTQTVAGNTADLMSVTVDTTNQYVWVTYWEDSSDDGFTVAYNYILGQTVAPTQIITNVQIRELTTVATDRLLTVFYENVNTYAYSSVVTDYISTLTVTPPLVGVGPGTPTAPTVLLRSVGLASKAIIAFSGTIYMMIAYGDMHQTPSTNNSNEPTYFLIDSTGKIIMRLAGTNAGGYSSSQVLPTISVVDGAFLVPYLITDFLATVNKGTALPTGTPTSAIYTQTGVNLATFEINMSNQFISEIAGALHLTGGQLWEYDGVRPVEHGFHVYPENIGTSTSGTGGSISAQTYNYVFTYEWTDNQGMLHRSAPSIPITQITTGATSSNTLNVPTDRLTYKLAPNPIRIVGYRWSTAQPVYYQFTSLTSPTVNNTAVDYVTIVDTNSDAQILGQTLLYTTGGVIENIAAPASIASALFKNRLFIIDAEDPNLLWYSKQVIQNTPVEMSDLLTLFVAPTSGAQGSTGPMAALSAMDDKLIMFKRDAIYYLTGLGPDNTGSQNDFTDPIFITSTVGCDNPDSIVLTPNGIMFQSDKGIWLLGRDLSTTYIGAPVEQFNDTIVMSAEAIPGTNEVRFILDNNTTLMYDYFFNEWAIHTNIYAISATLYQGRHTYLNSFGQVLQETPETFIDGSVPVLMSLVTSWINVAGLQGYERFYFANLLGTYITPFKLNVSLAYNYNAGIQHSIMVTPDNFTEPWGGEALWGSGGPWGGIGNVFSVRLFPEKQKCESFQVTIQEVYDSSLGVAPGEGLSLSGLALVVGFKKGYRTQKASRSFG